MRRPDHHGPLDLVSLAGGALCLLAATLYLLADLTGLGRRSGLVAGLGGAVVLLATGAGCLAAALRRLRDGDRAEPPALPPAVQVWLPPAEAPYSPPRL